MTDTSVVEQSTTDIALDTAMSMATRACGISVRNAAEAKFHTITTDSMTKIETRMAEIDRANRSLGRSATGVTDKLMSLTMMAESPFRAMRQCLAKIESRRNALKANLFELRKKRVMLHHKKLDFEYLVSDKSVSIARIEIEEMEDGLKDSILYIEGAIKEIGVYQDAYEQIRVNNGIRENWDERDAEAAEVKHHISTAFLHGVRDVLANGRLGMGTMEYLQQFGVSPLAAIPFINDFISASSEKIAGFNSIQDLAISKYDGYEDLTKFLDSISVHFYDSHKKVMSRLGLDDGSLISLDFVYKED